MLSLTTLLIPCIALMTGAAMGQVKNSFRDDKVSLNGSWKFELRHDNQLTTSGPVKFGPVSASSQLLLSPVSPEAIPFGAKIRTMPWGVSATVISSRDITPSEGQIWRPHPQQTGPTWWQADLGSRCVAKSS